MKIKKKKKSGAYGCVLIFSCKGFIDAKILLREVASKDMVKKLNDTEKQYHYQIPKQSINLILC